MNHRSSLVKFTIIFFSMCCVYVENIILWTLWTNTWTGSRLYWNDPVFRCSPEVYPTIFVICVGLMSSELLSFGWLLNSYDSQTPSHEQRFVMCDDYWRRLCRVVAINRLRRFSQTRYKPRLKAVGLYSDRKRCR